MLLSFTSDKLIKNKKAFPGKERLTQHKKSN
jgi:hypothetical protein